MRQYIVEFTSVRRGSVVVAADSFEEAVAKARTTPPRLEVRPVFVAEDENGAESQAVVGKCNWCGLEIVAHDGARRYYFDPDNANKYICGECAPESLVLFYKGS